MKHTWFSALAPRGTLIRPKQTRAADADAPWRFVVSVVCGIVYRTWPAEVHVGPSGRPISTPKLDGVTHKDLQWEFIWAPGEYESVMAKPAVFVQFSVTFSFV